MKKIGILTLIFLLTSALAQAQEAKQHHAQMPLNCQECHNCGNPTYEYPCLKIFPDFRRRGISVNHSVEEAPEIFIIDTLSSDYEASVFTHKLHAEMAEMSGGCAFCHHHNPPGGILACVDCHEVSIIRTDLNRPTLKGAYHQQCLSCHRTWAENNEKQTDCLSCHVRKGSASTNDKKQYIGISHPGISAPVKHVFMTGYEEGKLVTFYHQQHVETFGITCASCHKDNNCSRCHSKETKVNKTATDVHQACLSCHEKAINDNCQTCHDTKEKEAFTHAQTGWPLNAYHQKLSCKACHSSAPVFTKLNRNCDNCHAGWTNASFDHSRTGLVLDENHREQDCISCHLERKFEQPPVCSDCHENSAFPQQQPGTMLKRKP